MLSCELLGPYDPRNTGLGNQLFLYALTRTVAEMKGYNFYINAKQWQGHRLFDLDMGVKDGDIKHIFSDSYEQTFDPAVFDVEDFTSFNGNFESEKYFNHEKVRQWFNPKIKKVNEYIFDKYCFIHFRGGDYSIPPWDTIQLPMAYYNEAKEMMLTINPDLKFAVVTNAYMEAFKLFNGDIIISNSIEEDFALLASARYLIISNSSFSWWTAWLNPNNTVIAPQGWFNYNTDKQKFSPADIKVERFIWI